ncbi:chain length determinant protein EpsF [Kinneretia aquatilis]|jgi:chain length determinant protein EpsF|uniref:chain length determinant protein EpsF n=1 Tax=Kinneretia aquatilis TaxID=2070761 RepID=UPI0014951DEC|nr:chain length determinant protein EpsF [Paucibacter aquatile]WIV96561.1 chain length determinant protein EpsF [Paucibacter aquatile]
MSFSQFFSILLARKWIAALVLGLTVVTTLAVSLLLPKQYTATASVVLDVKPDPVSAMAYGGLTSPAFMATQVDVIQSDRVAQKVVRNLKLNESPVIREQWLEDTKGQGSLEVWLADTFKKKLDVRPSRESNVISVSYSAPDPRFAAGLANAFVQSYLETSLELRVDPAKQYSSFFETRAKEAREMLEKAQAKLSDFQTQKGIIAADERLDIENARLNELSSHLVIVQSMAAESSSRQAQAVGSSGDRMQEVLNNPVVSGLKADISRLEGRLQELNAKLGDKHPQVVELKANIEELRARMDAEVKRVTAGVGVSNSIVRQRESQIRADLEAQRNKVLQLKAVRDEGSVLVRDVENAQRAYDVVISRFNQTNLESQTTQSNANILTQAVAPVEPASPRVLLNVVLSVVLGLMLAVGVALVMEMLDRRVRSFEDISQGLGLPVLGVMPKPTAGGRKGKLALSSMQQSLVTSLPAPRKGI